MKRISIISLLLLSVARFAAQAPEQVDTAAINQIREQGLKQSQVMDTLFYLTDVHGPRLTGSPGFEAAGDWAVERLKSWGFQNARKERWAYGTGWSLDRRGGSDAEMPNTFSEGDFTGIADDQH
jgi:hypothetical protein